MPNIMAISIACWMPGKLACAHGTNKRYAQPYSRHFIPLAMVKSQPEYRHYWKYAWVILNYLSGDATSHSGARYNLMIIWCSQRRAMSSHRRKYLRISPAICPLARRRSTTIFPANAYRQLKMAANFWCPPAKLPTRTPLRPLDGVVVAVTGRASDISIYRYRHYSRATACEAVNSTPKKRNITQCHGMRGILYAKMKISINMPESLSSSRKFKWENGYIRLSSNDPVFGRHRATLSPRRYRK